MKECQTLAPIIAIRRTILQSHLDSIIATVLAAAGYFKIHPSLCHLCTAGLPTKRKLL